MQQLVLDAQKANDARIDNGHLTMHRKQRELKVPGLQDAMADASEKLGDLRADVDFHVGELARISTDLLMGRHDEAHHKLERLLDAVAPDWRFRA